MLLNLSKKMRVNFKKSTLAELAALVYADTNNGSVMTEELKMLGQLLCGNDKINFDNIPLIAEDPAKSVKSNVHQLLWGSYLWRQEGVTKALAVSLEADKKEEGNKNECINHRL